MEIWSLSSRVQFDLPLVADQIELSKINSISPACPSIILYIVDVCIYMSLPGSFFDIPSLLSNENGKTVEKKSLALLSPLCHALPVIEII